ncbi:probable inactive nicotinamidase At3g16190 isoform X2 [Andrographis paniculata]|uniref:probable inactive nicotinamidase At3g16190 isoform X2 n=1 Tax=Andrographis paniculata TaxID=175694 RepID=UPI0021E7CD11|nr:probable inactive nicotinamidase At3g16190 isoform X2 [Andrographis paniculata]
MAVAEMKWTSTALIVIGMQKDYVSKTSPSRMESGEVILPNVIKTVDVARSRGMPIVVREHDHLGRDVELFRRHNYVTPDKPKPVIKGRPGTELVDELEIKDSDYKLVKTRFSAFFNTNLHSYLQAIGVNSLVIIGLQTPNCIRQTVFDAVSFDYQSVKVIADASGAAAPDIHEVNLYDIRKINVGTPTLEEWSKPI